MKDRVRKWTSRLLLGGAVACLATGVGLSTYEGKVKREASDARRYYGVENWEPEIADLDSRHWMLLSGVFSLAAFGVMPDRREYVVKVAHGVGLTNLSDEQVRKYTGERES